MKISDTVFYVGVSDNELDLFEGQYVVPNGMAYNSYVISDGEVAVFDTVEKKLGAEWIENIKSVLSGASPDYLIVQHMEPDHSANIALFAESFPLAKIVSSAKAFSMMKSFFGLDFEGRKIEVKEGDSLFVGKRKISFIAAPMVHWPEVIMSYDEKEKILFSADAFGKFGTFDCDEPWVDEARRYYIGIVGKYGLQVQSLFKKLAGLQIEKICSLHGPVLSENIGDYISLYDKWSSYSPEKDGVLIAYASVYGNTRLAAEKLASMLSGKIELSLVDLTRSDMSYAVAEAFKYSKLVLASVTYNAELFPAMREFLVELTERNFSRRKLGIIENGSWAPMAAKRIKSALENSKDVEFLEPVVKINSALNEASVNELQALAKEILK